ncbi:MAG: transporter permease, partial [Hymenobacter sp.]|nr:transporter permease [Hymenobacter sp.]
METLTALFAFWHEQAGKLGEQTAQHIGLTAASLLLGVLLGVPLGLGLSRRPRWAPPVLGL